MAIPFKLPSFDSHKQVYVWVYCMLVPVAYLLICDDMLRSLLLHIITIACILANFPPTHWLEAVGATLVYPGDDQSGVASGVVVITCYVYLGQ